MNRSRETRLGEGPNPPRRRGHHAPGAPETVDERILAVLTAHGVPPVEQVGPHCFRFKAVPMAPGFNKPRANILLRRIPGGQPGQGIVQAFVDEDLVYAAGQDRALAQSLDCPDPRAFPFVP